VKKPTRFIGKLNYDIQNIADEYHQLAIEDEEVGRFLLANRKYRHSVYLFVQSQ